MFLVMLGRYHDDDALSAGDRAGARAAVLDTSSYDKLEHIWGLQSENMTLMLAP